MHAVAIHVQRHRSMNMKHYLRHWIAQLMDVCSVKNKLGISSAVFLETKKRSIVHSCSILSSNSRIECDPRCDLISVNCAFIIFVSSVVDSIQCSRLASTHTGTRTTKKRRFDGNNKMQCCMRLSDEFDLCCMHRDCDISPSRAPTLTRSPMTNPLEK